MQRTPSLLVFCVFFFSFCCCHGTHGANLLRLVKTTVKRNHDSYYVVKGTLSFLSLEGNFVQPLQLWSSQKEFFSILGLVINIHIYIYILYILYIEKTVPYTVFFPKFNYKLRS
jgi:hypothetical protein